MSIHNKSFSTILQELAKKHYNRQITFEEYRARRRSLFLQIDEYFNDSGQEGAQMTSDASDDDSTQPFLLGNTLAVSAQTVQEIEKKKY